MGGWQKIISGRDAFFFKEEHRAPAEDLAAFLPEVRKAGENLTGGKGPKAISLMLSARFPGLLPLYGFPTLLLAALVFFFTSLLLYWDWQRATLPLLHRILLVLVLLTIYILGYVWRVFARVWSRAGGLAVPRRGAAPLILIHWPRPPRPPAAEEFVLPIEDRPAARYILAHEYAHWLLRSLKRTFFLPAWLDEGFAFWLAEVVTQSPYWRPESRELMAQEDFKGDPRRTLRPGDERYMRLMVRYYWEVRTLAEAGKLPEVLKASKKELEALRPTFTESV